LAQLLNDRIDADCGEQTFWLSPDGDPLWMTSGRDSKDYIPTCEDRACVYT